MGEIATPDDLRRHSGMRHGKAPADTISGTNEKPTTNRKGNQMPREVAERLRIPNATTSIFLFRLA
jgi:hypothetical protein